MRSFLAILSLCSLLSLMQGCISKRSPIYVLGTPRFVPQSSPDSIVDVGIRQDPNTGKIFLQWYKVPSASGYKIYRSDTTDQAGTPISFTAIGNVSASTVYSDTSMIDPGPCKTGIRYYYYLRAYDVDGSVSGPSDTANYKLLNRPDLRRPPPNAKTSAVGFYFYWHDYTGGGLTVVRVKDISTVPEEMVWVSKQFQVFSSYPTETYDFDSTATAPLISGHSYEWRVERFDLDGTGRPYEGSTSPWSIFTIE